MTRITIHLISWVLVGIYVPIWYALYWTKELFNRAFERYDKLMP
jgi:hypothetical protein